MRSQVQAAPFLQRVIGLSLKDGVRSLVILARLSIAATPPPLICWNLAPDMQYKKRMDNGEQWILKNLFKKKKIPHQGKHSNYISLPRPNFLHIM